MGLETGWGPATATNDTVLRSALVTHADAFEHVVRSRGGRTLRDGGLALADAGSPSIFFNSGFVLSAPGDGGLDALLDRIEAFFGSRHGGGAIVFVPWPVAPPNRAGWELAGYPPVMFRPAGTSSVAAPPVALPPELRIDEVADDELLSAFEAVLVEGFPMEELRPPYPGCVLDGRALDASFHCWVGSVGGRAVAASAAYFAPDLVLVAWVATLAEHRGRGYGAAVTWAAIREAPGLPAALIASDPGRPVYERLGFLPLARVTCLVLTERRRVSS